MKTKTRTRAESALLVAVLAAADGCSVVRENILSSVNTGIGATVAENPQTQLYEAKFGFFRSQFYCIPTSKTILKENSTNQIEIVRKDGTVVKGTSEYSPLTDIAADRTPEIVSSIRVQSRAQELFLGVDIAECFAVGPEAVKSPAAVAMYGGVGAEKTSYTKDRTIMKIVAAVTASQNTVDKKSLQGVLHGTRLESKADDLSKKSVAEFELELRKNPGYTPTILAIMGKNSDVISATRGK